MSESASSNDDKKRWKAEAEQLKKDLSSRQKVVQKNEVAIRFGSNRSKTGGTSSQNSSIGSSVPSSASGSQLPSSPNIPGYDSNADNDLLKRKQLGLL